MQKKFFHKCPHGENSHIFLNMTIATMSADLHIESIDGLNTLPPERELISTCDQKVLNKNLFDCAAIFQYCAKHILRHNVFPNSFMSTKGFGEQFFLIKEEIEEALTERELRKLNSLFSKEVQDAS